MALDLERLDHLKRKLTLRKIEIFVTVVRLGSVSLAAEQLKASKPYISATVSAIEDLVGVPIFARKGRSFTLTKEGCEIQRHLERTLHSFERLCEGA